MKYKILLLICTLFCLSGCAKTEASTIEPETSSGKTEKNEIVYVSQIAKEDCALCGKQEDSLLSCYTGEKNIGVISLNTFDISPVEINRYDDYGKLIEEPSQSTSMKINSFGEGRMNTHIAANTDRGYADVNVSFTKDKHLDKKAVENILCQDCLNVVTENFWDTPYGVGVINFDTLEIKLFEENVTAFSFGDYYINIEHHENQEDTNQVDLDILVFYCPPRYQ